MNMDDSAAVFPPGEERELPLFPLSGLVFPGGRLPLRVFELRYTDMVARVMRVDSRFGICLLRSGSEVGKGGVPRAVGTCVKIVDFGPPDDGDRLDAGFLSITVCGEQRFRVFHRRQRRDGLWMARVRFLEPEPRMKMPAALRPLGEMLRDIYAQLGISFGSGEPHYDDAGWVGGRLVEILPLPADLKQSLLEMTNPVRRLERLRPAISRLNRG